MKIPRYRIVYAFASFVYTCLFMHKKTHDKVVKLVSEGWAHGNWTVARCHWAEVFLSCVGYT